jgi:predicted O-methyltransferase YrrM
MHDAPDAYLDIANVEQPEQERFYRETVARLAPFGRRSLICRMTSLEAAEKVTEYTMDFVYLDARHDYEAVLDDLRAWYPKIRPGGVIAGHDYLDGNLPAGVFGVKSAVDEFFGALGIPVRHTHLDGPWLSWIVVVPEPS